MHCGQSDYNYNSYCITRLLFIYILCGRFLCPSDCLTLSYDWVSNAIIINYYCIYLDLFCDVAIYTAIYYNYMNITSFRPNILNQLEYSMNSNPRQDCQPQYVNMLRIHEN